MKILVAPVARAVAILSLLGAVAAPLSQGQVSVFKPQNQGGNSSSVADFNRGDRRRVVQRKVMPPTGSILQFFDTPQYQAGTRPVAIATADFNGDGRPDLVVVNAYDNTVSILLGNGDGTFQAHKGLRDRVWSGCDCNWRLQRRW